MDEFFTAKVKAKQIPRLNLSFIRMQQQSRARKMALTKRDKRDLLSPVAVAKMNRNSAK